MKLKLLDKLIMLSKLSLYGLVIQCFMLSSIWAEDINAQKIQSVGDVKVQLVFGKAKLEKIFKMLEENTDFHFSYSKEDIDSSLDITFDKGQTHAVRDVLIEVSKKSGLRFRQVNRNIIVRKGDNSWSGENEVEVFIEDIDINGKITDENGEGLPGASVIEKGTSNGTTTDLDGNYKMSTDSDAIIVISFVGYKTQEIEVGSQSVLDVAMQLDAEQLEEVVIIGYGTVKKSDLTGSVGSIKSEEIGKQPVARIDLAMQGQVAGVQVTSINGAPGTGSTIRIRGGNSINAGNEPLFVIDGFIGGVDLSTINPSDIESIEILKDASATAIYGSRGSNGVVLITTKRGSKAKGLGVSYNAYVGTQSPVKKIDLLNGEEFAQYRNEYAELIGETPPFPNIGAVSNTNWQDVLFRKAMITNHNLSFYNNTSSTNYFVSLNYFNQEGIQLGSSFERYQIRLNFDHKVGDLFKVGASMNTAYTVTENPRAWGVGGVVLPTAPIYNDDGSFFSTDQINGSTYDNPIAQDQLIIDDTFGNKTLGNVYLQFNPIKGLNIKSTLGFDFSNSKNNIYHSANLPTRFEAGKGGFASVGTGFTKTIQNENTISYYHKIGDHEFNLLGGWTFQRYNFEQLDANSQGFSNDATTFNAIETGNPELLKASSDEVNWALLSGLFRVNYTFKSKYLITISGRNDGSSRLAEDNKWQFFPSAAFAWKLSEEPFLKGMSSVSNLKLRISYGKTGSQSISPYSTLARLRSSFNYLGGQQVVTFIPDISANPSLKWELTNQYDIGFELGFFNNRLNFVSDFYYKKTTDLLLSRELAFQTGFSSVLENVGSLQNVGLDFSFEAIVVEKENLTYSSTLTLSANRNKILELSGGKDFLTNGIGSRLIVGEPIGTFFGAKFIGLWKEEDKDLGSNIVGGPKFEDLDNNGLITVDDGQILGNGVPDFYGGFNNIVRYKRFTLSMFMDFNVGNEIFDLEGRTLNTGHASNVYGKYRHRWSQDNTNTNVPRAGAQLNSFFSNYSGENGSNLVMSDGSYVRLKTLNLQLDVPANKSVFKSLSAYISVSNLFTLTKYKGFSPDVNSSGTNSTRRGFDSNGYPLAKTLLLGVKVDF